MLKSLVGGALILNWVIASWLFVFGKLTPNPISVLIYLVFTLLAIVGAGALFDMRAKK